MAEHEENRFRPRPRPPRSRGAPYERRFLSRVIAAVNRAGGTHRAGWSTPSRRTSCKRGRGFVAARLGGTTLHGRSRRVIIKTRLIVLNLAGSRAVAAHLRYIVREGTSRGGQPSQAYDPTSNSADLKAFEARGQGDRHQFRFIVSAEDGTQIADLRAFTRELMQRIEKDLGTRLDWVAVDHWDTDNPHTHLVVRGKDHTGRDLVIARDYISGGMRRRACELATEWLGPRTDAELRASMQSQVDQERWTPLDLALQAQSSDGVIDLRGIGRQDVFRRSLLLGRLQRLSTMGLADSSGPGQWRIRSDAEATLRTMGERDDIVRTMQRALSGVQRELAIFDGTRSNTIVGRVAAKGLLDELSDRAYVIIDGTDGRAHHVALPGHVNLADLPINGIAAVHAVSERAVDRRILALAEQGVYSTEVHLAELRSGSSKGFDAEAVVEAHSRRLEALRRAGIVERIGDGMWRVPANLPARAHAYDRRRLGGSTVDLLSHLPIERQISAIGATWLDEQLVTPEELAGEGFGAAVRDALNQRGTFLVQRGCVERRGHQIIAGHNLLTTLRNQEMDQVGPRIAARMGLAYRPLVDGRVEGNYRRAVMLKSGRFAMLDDGLGFSLVPWRPLLEHRLGQNVAVIVRGDNISWQFTRKLGRSL